MCSSPAGYRHDFLDSRTPALRPAPSPRLSARRATPAAQAPALWQLRTGTGSGSKSPGHLSLSLKKPPGLGGSLSAGCPWKARACLPGTHGPSYRGAGAPRLKPAGLYSARHSTGQFRMPMGQRPLSPESRPHGATQQSPLLDSQRLRRGACGKTSRSQSDGHALQGHLTCCQDRGEGQQCSGLGGQQEKARFREETAPPKQGRRGGEHLLRFKHPIKSELDPTARCREGDHPEGISH